MRNNHLPYRVTPPRIDGPRHSRVGGNPGGRLACAFRALGRGIRAAVDLTSKALPRHWIPAFAGMTVALTVFAQDHADIDKSQIIGNRELPKVLYIVPWKKPMPGDLSGRPLESVLDEALAPLDKDVFKRQVTYAQPADVNKSAAIEQAVPSKPETPKSGSK